MSAYKIFPISIGMLIIFCILLYYFAFGILERKQDAMPSVILQAELAQLNEMILEGGEKEIIYRTNLNFYNGFVHDIWSFNAQAGSMDFRQYNRLARLALLRAIMIKEWPLYMAGFWIAFHMIGMCYRVKRELNSTPKSSNELNIGYGIANAIPFVPLIYMIAPLKASPWNMHILMGLSIVLMFASRMLVTQNKNIKGLG